MPTDFSRYSKDELCNELVKKTKQLLEALNNKDFGIRLERIKSDVIQLQKLIKNYKDIKV
jgi:hypothetical protein